MSVLKYISQICHETSKKGHSVIQHMKESHQICYQTPIKTFIFKELTTLTSNLHSLWSAFQLPPEMLNYNPAITEMLIRENDGMNK